MKQLWRDEAVKYNVLPLDDRRVERFNSDLAGRPRLIKGELAAPVPRHQTARPDCVLNIKNKSHSVSAQLQVPDGGAEGVIISQGGAFAGWSLYLKAGKPTYQYNFAGLQRFTIDGETKVPAGQHQVRIDDGGGLAKGGTVTLYIDGDNIGQGRVETTLPMIFSGDETCDLGSDTASPVSPDYTPETGHFTGKIEWVQIDIAEAAEDLDHLITPGERLRIAMARQ